MPKTPAPYPGLSAALNALNDRKTAPEVRHQAQAIVAEAAASGHHVLPRQSPPLRDYHPDAGFRAELTMGLGEALCWMGLGVVAAGVVFVLWWGLS